MQAGVGLLHSLDLRSPMNGAAVPQEDDVSAEVPQERPQEVSNIDRLEVARLEAQVQTHMMALRRDREGG
jgi:hypothetical protein